MDPVKLCQDSKERESLTKKKQNVRTIAGETVTVGAKAAMSCISSSDI